MSDRLIHQPANAEFDVPAMQRRRIRIWWGLGGALVLLLGFAAYSQSAWFGRSIIRALNAKGEGLTFAAESFRLVGLNRFEGAGLQVEDERGERVFECRQLSVGFDPIEWVQGNFAVRSAIIDGGVLRVIEGDDDLNSIGSLWKVFTKRRARTRFPLRGVQIDRIELTDAELQFEWKDRPDARIQVSEIQATCENLSPGEETSLTWKALTRFESDAGTSLEMSSAGELGLSLRASAMPRKANGSLAFEFRDGVGRLSDWSGASGEFKVAIQPEQVDEMSLRFNRQGSDLGSILVQGPFDSDRMEGRLRMTASELRRPALNLLSVVTGVDFGESQLQADFTVDWAFGGAVISMRGEVQGREIELIKGGVRTPKTSLVADYSFQYNDDDSSVLIQKLEISATSDGSEWLKGQLGAPVILSWGDARPGIKEPKFDFLLKDFDVQAWASFFLLDLPPGRLSLKADTTILRDGQVVLSEVSGDLLELEVPFPNGDRSLVDLNFGFKLQIDNMKRISILGLKYAVEEEGDRILSGDGVSAYHFEDRDFTLQLVALGPLKAFTDRTSVDGLDLKEGHLDAMLRVKSRDESHDLILNVSFSELRGNYGAVEFDDHRFDWQLDTKISGARVLLNNLTAKARKGFAAAGSLGFNGNYDLETRTGSVRFQSVGINRNLFGQALDPYFSSQHLGDAELKLDGVVEVDLAGESRLNGKLGVTQLKRLLRTTDSELVEEATAKDENESQQETAVPLDFEFGIQASYSESGLVIKDGSLQLAKTERADNSARFDLSFPRSSGDGEIAKIRLRAERLDLEPYWTWGGQALTERTKSLSVHEGLNLVLQGSASDDSEKRLLEISTNVGELYLQGLALTNLVAQSTVGRDLVLIDPFKASANGGEIELTAASAVDQSRPESRNISVDLRIENVSLEGVPPLFLPPERAAFAGKLDARMVVDGRLARGSGSNTDLRGNFSVNLEQADYPFLDAKEFPWLAPLLTGLNLPSAESLRLDDLVASMSVEGNELNVKALVVEGSALKLATEGGVTLNQGLSSQVQLPVSVWIRKPVAGQAALVPGPDAADETGVLLPDFLSLGGTLNRIRFEVDQATIANWALERMQEANP